MTWISANWSYIASVLWISCELLNQISSVQSNSVLELIIGSIVAAIKGQAKLPPS